jgi:hypothetical protein
MGVSSVDPTAHEILIDRAEIDGKGGVRMKIEADVIIDHLRLDTLPFWFGSEPPDVEKMPRIWWTGEGWLDNDARPVPNGPLVTVVESACG